MGTKTMILSASCITGRFGDQKYDPGLSVANPLISCASEPAVLAGEQAPRRHNRCRRKASKLQASNARPSKDDRRSSGASFSWTKRTEGPLWRVNRTGSMNGTGVPGEYRTFAESTLTRSQSSVSMPRQITRPFSLITPSVSGNPHNPLP